MLHHPSHTYEVISYWSKQYSCSYKVTVHPHSAHFSIFSKNTFHHFHVSSAHGDFKRFKDAVDLLQSRSSDDQNVQICQLILKKTSLFRPERNVFHLVCDRHVAASKYFLIGISFPQIDSAFSFWAAVFLVAANVTSFGVQFDWIRVVAKRVQFLHENLLKMSLLGAEWCFWMFPWQESIYFLFGWSGRKRGRVFLPNVS